MKRNSTKASLEKTVAKLEPLSVNPNHSFEIGRQYLIQTVTNYFTGIVIRITESDLVLENAAWIPIVGRFATAIKTGVFEEVEPFTESVIINRGAIINSTNWPHALPREQK